MLILFFFFFLKAHLDVCKQEGQDNRKEEE